MWYTVKHDVPIYQSTSRRESEEDKRFLKLLSEQPGITQTAGVRQAIRLLARKEGMSSQWVEKKHV